MIVLKVGRTNAGERAALAHTGAIVGDQAVVRAALRQAGVVQVDSLEDLLITGGLLAYEQRPLGRRLAAVTASGGACDLIADRATDEGIELPEFSQAITEGLTELLPAFSNPRNPLDVTGYVVVDPTISHRALDIVVDRADGAYDTILYHATLPQNPPPDPTPITNRLMAVKAAVDRSAVPVVIQAPSSTDISPFARSVLQEAGLHAMNSIEHGMTALGRAIDYHERRRRRLVRRATEASAAPLAAPPAPHGTAGEVVARDLLASGGVPVVPAQLATNADAAVAAAREIGFPVVLKVVSPDVTHKTDVGGVAVDLRGPEEVASAIASMSASVKRLLPDAVVTGFLVSPMRMGGVELLVSVRRDPSWGLVLAVGLGGVWVEALNDTSLRLLPVSADDVLEALAELRGASLLEGGRNTTPVSLPRVAEAIVSIASVAERLGSALDILEVNPLWAAGERVEVLDALVVWR